MNSKRQPKDRECDKAIRPCAEKTQSAKCGGDVINALFPAVGRSVCSHLADGPTPVVITNCLEEAGFRTENDIAIEHICDEIWFYPSHDVAVITQTAK